MDEIARLRKDLARVLRQPRLSKDDVERLKKIAHYFRSAETGGDIHEAADMLDAFIDECS